MRDLRNAGDEMMALSDAEINALLSDYRAAKEEFQSNADRRIKLQEYPNMVLDGIHYLRVNKGMVKEGIFRVNGDAKSVERIRDTYRDLIMGDTQDALSYLVQEGLKLNVFDVATAVKAYFRLLKDPLVPNDIYERMKDIVEEESSAEKIRMELQEIIGEIPQPNLRILCFFMKFLQDICGLEEHNKMTPANMATCLTMSVTRFQTDDTKATSHIAAMMEVALSTKILAKMITDIDYDSYITAQETFKMLQNTHYRPELLPETMEQFYASVYYKRGASVKFGLASRNNNPPAVPPRNTSTAVAGSGSPPPVPPKAPARPMRPVSLDLSEI